MTKREEFKQKLARIFDGDLSTTQWGNIFDYIIIGLIIISTITVFISTFDVSPQCEQILRIIDIVTVIAFTIEVSLRIWSADAISEEYKGFWGRVKYCFTFYGMIDFLSTYTFYIAFFIPLPYAVLKSLRVVRLIRVFRYMRSFRLLQQAIMSKSKELLISMQFLVVVTLMLSFVLFFYEHAAQPDIYNNGIKSVVWSFAQYIGDPGQVADNPPITIVGRVVASIIGLLGIAIFAVPAGLIGAGFSEAMEEELKKEELEENHRRLCQAFERKLHRPTGFQIVPPYLSVTEIQARMSLKADEIIDTVESSENFRLINLASTQTIDEHPQDILAVEHFATNRPYGCMIDRGSKITIFSPSNIVDPAIGWFSYYLAKIGDFNYIARELGEKRPYKSFYKFENADSAPGLAEFLEDMNTLTKADDAWVITMLPASGANEPAFPTQVHINAGGEKGNEDIYAEGLTVLDRERLKEFVESCIASLKSEFDVDTDFQRYHGMGINGKNHFSRKLDNTKANCFSLVLAWSLCLWDSRHISVAKHLAELIAKHIEGKSEIELSSDLKRKGTGFNDYTE